jgi:GxxExxY protein
MPGARISDEMTDLTYNCNAAAWSVHRALGPGLPEDLYRESLAIELRSRGFDAREAAKLPGWYRGTRLRRTYEVDILVNNILVIETKVASTIAPIHVAQTIAYLRMSNLHVAMIYNFNVDRFNVGGFRRIINPHFDSTSVALFPFSSVASVSTGQRPERM